MRHVSQNQQMQQSLGTAEAAQILGIEVRTVHRMVADGRLRPAMKLPGKTGAYVFARVEVERLAAERRAADAA